MYLWSSIGRGLAPSRARWAARGCAGVLAFGLALALSAEVVLPAEPPVETLIYKRVAGRELKLFLHRPPGWSVADRRPALLFIHGGGWVGGGVTVFTGQARHFASRGLVCAILEYRLLSKENLDPPLLCIQDAKSALRWLRARACEWGIDSTRIGAVGASAGGQLAAFLGMMDGADDPSDDGSISARAQAAILLNPVLHNGPGPWGYGYKRTGDHFLAYSPFHNVTARAAPTLVLLGTKDKLVPVPMIEEFATRMRAARVRCDVHLYEGQEHSFFSARNANGEYFRRTLATADAFLVSLGWLPADVKDLPMHTDSTEGSR